MSLGLFNCRLINPLGISYSSSPAVLPHRCQFGQALFNLLVTRPARPRPAGGRGMLLVFFLIRKVLFWFSEGAKPPSGVGGFTPPIHPRIPPKIPPILPIDSAIEPEICQGAHASS